MEKPIALAADHGGYELKNSVRDYLAAKGLETVDFGTLTGERCDYPDLATPACQAVLEGRCRTALLFCGTGAGISIAANKIKGIRAVCCSDAFTAEYARRHNDANALCLGGRVLGPGLAATLVELFLETEFEGGRHAGRVAKISALEEK